ncbi:MAG: YlmC/YmxH family sporulation protein [Clostridia bacterium]|nr:YlmC/YmxH family sporulation protein [Clostridia bacterium]
MHCKISDLKNKDVVCVKDGVRLGYVGDACIDTCTAQVLSIIVYGKCKYFGLFGREDETVINWCDIEIIGQDTILVNCDCAKLITKRPGKFDFWGRGDNFLI